MAKPKPGQQASNMRGMMVFQTPQLRAVMWWSCQAIVSSGITEEVALLQHVNMRVMISLPRGCPVGAMMDKMDALLLLAA